MSVFSLFTTHPHSTYLGMNMPNLLVEPNDSLDYLLVATDVNGVALPDQKVEVVLWQHHDDAPEVRVASDRITTKAQLYSYAFPVKKPLEPGLYELRAKSADGAFTSIQFRVPGTVAYRPSSPYSVSLFTDQSQYLPGEHATLLLRTALPRRAYPVHALLSFERGKIHDYQVVTLDGPEVMVPFDIADEMAPVIYAQLALFYEGALFSAVQPILVQAPERRIQVNITSERTDDPLRYQLHIKTSDSHGQPVSSGLALLVNDEPSSRSNPFTFFYGKRPLQVFSAHNAHDPTPLRSTFFLDPPLPSFYSDGSQLAGFSPHLKTNENGELTLPITLPSLDHRWNITAMAYRSFDEFGSANMSLLDPPTIELSPFIPESIRSGEQVSLRMLVRNLSAERQAVSVLASSSALSMVSDSIQVVEVPAHSVGWMTWMIQANDTPVPLTDTVRFESAFKTLQTPIAVLPSLRAESHVVRGRASSSIVERFRFPADSSSLAQIEVSLSTSPLVFLPRLMSQLTQLQGTSADELAAQILVYSTIESLKNSHPDFDLSPWISTRSLHHHLLVNQALNQLEAFQNSDGGFSLWNTDMNSDPLLSAFVAVAVHRANEFIANPRTELLAHLTDYLRARLSDDTFHPTQKAYMLWAMSELGQFDTRSTVQLFEKRDQLSLFEQAVLLMNLSQLDQAGQKSVYRFVDRLQSELVTHLKKDAMIPADFQRSPQQVRAALLLALSRLNPSNPELPSLVGQLADDYQSLPFFDPSLVAWQVIGLLTFAVDYPLDLASHGTYALTANQTPLFQGDLSSLSRSFCLNRLPFLSTADPIPSYLI
ncbi:hypothetical protein IPJ72_01605 [Candidatus Peregrinibacteria bacterium]|nr:MAG: hypothetical protein IPJ72_01605 [Candidatus Peregrinibacteria bacterium]